ncbi:MAG: cobalamin-dependent protein [Synergistales bacterium]|nr:cobalamin-dependent protein [Synergistales bacterium]
MSIEKVRQLMIDGDNDAAVSHVQALLDGGTDPQAIMDGLTEEMEELGKKFENFEVFLPELMVAGDTFMQVVEVLKGYLVADAEGKGRSTIVVGAVKGDYHEIGKNIVGIILEANGFNVVDLGGNVDPVAFMEEAEKNNADAVALSALMTTTMPNQEEFIKLTREVGNTGKYLVCIGGAPTSPEWAEKIGADIWSFDAFDFAGKLKEALNR